MSASDLLWHAVSPYLPSLVFTAAFAWHLTPAGRRRWQQARLTVAYTDHVWTTGIVAPMFLTDQILHTLTLPLPTPLGLQELGFACLFANILHMLRDDHRSRHPHR